MVFLDTDKAEAPELAVASSYCNPIEALITECVIAALKTCGIKNEQISVISPFKPQIRQIFDTGISDVEVCTVDRYQGRDKDCVIISFVRSNPEGKVKLTRDHF